jgi:very-short-patch-repair endonuclease
LEYVKAVSENDRQTAERILLGLKGETVPGELKFQSSLIQDDLFYELTKRGLTVEKNVGIGTNKIDLAIRDKASQTYILGIELDTAADHNMNTTKEKDYHRQKYLASFGWDIERIWCSDYWRSKENEIERIMRIVDKYILAS